MVKKYGIIALIILICVIVLYIIVVVRSKPIENEEEAIEVAKAYVIKKYNRNYDENEINVYDASETDAVPYGKYWIVAFGIPSVYDENGNVLEVTAGGGGPLLKISKSNGKVFYCELQK